MSVGVMKDYKLKQRDLRASHTLGKKTRLTKKCVLDVIGAPSRLRLIRKAGALVRINKTRDLSIDEKAARRK